LATTWSRASERRKVSSASLAWQMSAGTGAVCPVPVVSEDAVPRLLAAQEAIHPPLPAGGAALGVKVSGRAGAAWPPPDRFLADLAAAPAVPLRPRMRARSSRPESGFGTGLSSARPASTSCRAGFLDQPGHGLAFPLLQAKSAPSAISIYGSRRLSATNTSANGTLPFPGAVIVIPSRPIPGHPSPRRLTADEASRRLPVDSGGSPVISTGRPEDPPAAAAVRV